MEFIVIAAIIIVFIFILKYVFKYSRKEIEGIAKNDRLDEIAQKYPDNIEIAKKCLKILKNENVAIEENEGSDSSLYIVATNKILIGNTRKSYTRIQTIAHECLHSIQDRRLLLFNFIFSNIQIIYFVVVCALAIFKVLPYKMMFISILAILGLIYLVVRIFLENDAMIKAKYLAKEYMEEEKISSKEEIRSIVDEYEKINSIGIKCTNYYVLTMIMYQILILSIICLIR